MGASTGATGTGGGSRRGRRGNRKGLNADINVTPLVDVMLVLLIVFMVAAPLMTSSIPVNLPKASGKPTSAPVEPTFITVQKDGKTYLGEVLMPIGQIIAELQAKSKNGQDESINIRADENLSYGEVLAVMGDLREAGFLKIGLVKLEPQTSGTN